jgi:putative ABC transport system ATP-binding protein
MLKLSNIRYEYTIHNRQLTVLSDVNYSFEQGSFTSICGPSGSGKTTLLNLLGLLDKPTVGDYIINTKNTRNMSDREKSRLRARTFGFLFQNFRLIPTMTVLENMTLALDIAGERNISKRIAKSQAALKWVGLEHRERHLPPELSGGEAQRVAFARALVKDPTVLLADEPTGNLDNDNAIKLLTLLKDFQKQGKTVIMVTHDPVATRYADTVLSLSRQSLHRVTQPVSEQQLQNVNQR